MCSANPCLLCQSINKPGCFLSITVSFIGVVTTSTILPYTTATTFIGAVSFRSDTNTYLPKLDLSQFSWNLLYWQPFWDSFEAAVDTNRSLSGVQKLSYLWAQLRGEESDWAPTHKCQLH